MTVRDFDRILGRDSIYEFIAKGIVYDYTNLAVTQNTGATFTGQLLQLSPTLSPQIQLLSEMGYEHVRDAPGKHGLYLWLLKSNRDDMPHIISFRGSEEMFDGYRIADDWQADLIDIDVGWRQFYGVNGIGSNVALLTEFYNAATALPGFNDKGLGVTGHSLGGALAQMFSSDSRWWNGVNEIVTFQSPGVGGTRLGHWEKFNGSEVTIRNHISAGDFVHMTGGMHLQNSDASFHYHIHNSLDIPTPHCVTLLCTNQVHNTYSAPGALPTSDAGSGFFLFPVSSSQTWTSWMSNLRSIATILDPESPSWFQLAPYDGSSAGVFPLSSVIDAVCGAIASIQTADGRRVREPLIFSTESDYSPYDQLMCGHIGVAGLDVHIPIIGVALNSTAELMRQAFGTVSTAGEGAFDALLTRAGLEHSATTFGGFALEVVEDLLNVDEVLVTAYKGARSKIMTRRISREIELAADVIRAQASSGGGP